MIYLGAAIIFVTCFVVGMVFCDYDEFNFKAFAISGIMFYAAFFYYNDGKNICVKETAECRNAVNALAAEEKREQELQDKVCTTPQLVTTAPDGTQLWVIGSCRNNPVYFSSKGTHTTHQEQRGKTTHTYNDDVSNGE